MGVDVYCFHMFTGQHERQRAQAGGSWPDSRQTQHMEPSGGAFPSRDQGSSRHKS